MDEDGRDVKESETEKVGWLFTFTEPPTISPDCDT
jgi:hypothetical protein